MSNLPTIKSLVTFLDEEHGGRKNLPVLPSSEYRPHIVIQSPDIRTATPEDHYLGVRFLAAPAELSFQLAYECMLELSYHPRVDYSKASAGATFTIREGGRVIGFGTITERME